MPKIEGIEHTWLVEVTKEPDDDWPDFQISTWLWITPEHLTVTFWRNPDEHAWVFKALRITGPVYRPLRSGDRKPHGPGSYRYAGGAPEEYHPLILDLQTTADSRYLRQ